MVLKSSITKVTQFCLDQCSWLSFMLTLGACPLTTTTAPCPPSATNGSPPAPESTPVAKEGAQINQGELLPETCPAEARVSAPFHSASLPLCYGNYSVLM